MAKDPAFLFYSGDFLVGTALFTEAETGQYIKILCFMHQSGHISKEDMFNICPNISFKVLAKFKTDKDGLFYNERLDIEVEKRKNYSESRRNNRLKVKNSNTSKTHVQSYDVGMSTHMENENENRIESINDNEGGPGETLEERLKAAFDEKTVTDLSMTFRNKDFDNELNAFLAKVRGSPAFYANHNTEGLRKAFNKQIRESRNKNANNFNSKAEQRTGSLVADFAKRAGAVPDK